MVAAPAEGPSAPEAAAVAEARGAEWSASGSAQRGRLALAAVLGMAGLWGLGFGWLAVQRLAAGGAHAEDLGFTDQVVWNFLRGQWFRMSIYDGAAAWNTELDISRLARPDSLLAFHFEPLLLLLVPLYALGGGVTLLLLLQAIAVAAGAVPAFRLGAHASGSQAAGLAVAAAYLLAPFGQWAVLADFHTSTLAAPLVLLAAERLVVARSPRQAVASALLAALAREDVGLVVAALGASVWWSTRSRRAGLVLLGGGLACTVVGLLVIRLYSGGGVPFEVRYGDTLGGGLGTTLGAFGRPAVVGYLTTILLSGGWLGLLAPLNLLPLLPSLALNGLSTSPWMMAGQAHYSALLLPAIALGAAAGLRRLRTSRPVVLAASLGLVLSSGVAYAAQGSGPLGGNFAAAHVTEHAQHAAEVAAGLPADVSVSASTGIVPWLTHRPRVYVFPAIDDAEYVFLDLTSSPAPTSAGDVFLRVRTLVDGGGWQVDYAANGLLLLRRLDAAGPTDIAEVAAALRASSPEPATTSPLGSYFDGRVSLLSAALVPNPQGAIDVDGPRWILRTTWRAETPLPPDTRLEFAIDLRDGTRLRRGDVADLWWQPPAGWPVGQPVTIDISDIPLRQFLSWQATYGYANQ